MSKKTEDSIFAPLPDEAAMAQLAYAHWERSHAESMAEYISRRRTVDLASLARQVVQNELSDNERAVIRLHFEENLAPIDIAERLHLHKSVTARTLLRAEDRVRQYLKYVVLYQHDMLHVPFLPLVVREAMVIAAARYGKADAASRLRNLRTGENLTPEAVGRAVGLSPERLCAIEDGQAVPDARELLRLSAFYGVCADSILKGEKTCRQH